MVIDYTIIAGISIKPGITLIFRMQYSRIPKVILQLIDNIFLRFHFALAKSVIIRNNPPKCSCFSGMVFVGIKVKNTLFFESICQIFDSYNCIKLYFYHIIIVYYYNFIQVKYSTCIHTSTRGNINYI